MKEKKYTNDDHSRMAGQDYREEPFEIGSVKESGLKKGPSVPVQQKNKTLDGKTGPDQATRRDLGVEEDV